MPCYSASNLRFISAKQQQQQGQQGQQYAKQERAKTAAYRFGSQQNLQTPHSLDIQCDDLLRIQGSGVVDSNKFMRKKQLRSSAVRTQQTVLPRKELERLKTASKIVTLEDRLDALMKQEQESKRLESEADRTRQHFKKIDDARKRAAEANAEKEDLFGAGEKLKVLERAFIAKHEQEEEVKRVNRIILNAKCHAVRDAQIQEKTELEKELREEQIRLEKMVLERAIKSQNAEDEKFEKQHEEKLRYARDIKKQLNERENLRFLEAERIEAEAKMLHKAHEATKRDEERQAQLQKERQIKFRSELAAIVEMSQLFKKLLCEQEKEAEMRVAAYMREKEQRERALTLQKKLDKEATERKQQLIFMVAQKALESRSQQEEMSYLREQEKIEREYRRKEKEAALRKQQLEKHLVVARERQMQETKHRRALQIARAEQDFNNLIERLKREEEKEKQIDEERERKRQCYRQDIIRQMGDKELERRRLQELENNQASAWRERERQRDANIKAVINAKLAAMRDACLPEKYIKDVEKQMQKIANTKNLLSKQPNS